MERAAPVLLALALACADCGAPRPASGPAGEPPWTEWGERAGGVRMRAAVRGDVLRGDRMSTRFELDFDPEAAGPGTTHVDLEGVDRRIWLVCSERGSGRVVEVAPYDCGMPDPPPPDGEDGRELRRGTTARLFPAFHFLSIAWDGLRPGEYEARLELRQPLFVSIPGGPENDGRGPDAWRGVARTAPFLLAVRDAPMKTLNLKVPVRLSLRGPRSPFHRVEVYCQDEDFETLEVEVHNGFEVGMRVDSDRIRMRGVPPDFGGRNGLDSIRDDHAGPFEATYVLEVYESAQHSAHLSSPGPGSPGWRVLWRRELSVSATAEEIQALRENR